MSHWVYSCLGMKSCPWILFFSIFRFHINCELQMCVRNYQGCLQCTHAQRSRRTHTHTKESNYCLISVMVKSNSTWNEHATHNKNMDMESKSRAEQSSNMDKFRNFDSMVKNWIYPLNFVPLMYGVCGNQWNLNQWKRFDFLHRHVERDFFYRYIHVDQYTCCHKTQGSKKQKFKNHYHRLDTIKNSGSILDFSKKKKKKKQPASIPK